VSTDSDKWKYREPAPELEKKEKKIQTINTLGADDNCYYVVAAYLVGKSVDALFQQTEVMQIAGGAKLGDIDALFKTAKLAGVWSSSFGNTEEVEGFIHSQARGLSSAYGLAFVWAGRTVGHAIIVRYDADKQECVYADYQVSTRSEPKVWKSTDLDERATSFRVFVPDPPVKPW
jgi:hypothetical protein